MIGSVVSKYKILEKLGEGGMGEVYLAQDTELNRRVALKFLPDQYASDADVLIRFKREAQLAAGLHHPNIITVYEVGDHDGRPYIAMAYVDGEPLSDIIAREDLTVDMATDIALQVLDGLASAHDAGIVHRDVKPGNIFIDRGGRVKILDFGLAKLGGATRITGKLSTMGTIYYMSPEQTRGEEVDKRSDLFSLGAMLYEMLTGRLPFQGEHTAAVVYSITNEEPKPLSRLYQRIPPEVEQVVVKALEKRPDDRYQSAGEMAADLKRIQAGLRPLAARPSRGLLKFILPTSVVFLAVVLLFVFKPFKFHISGDQQAVAAERSLAIMYFENVVDRDDPRRFGEIVTNLLITDLSESEYLQVVSSQRLYDILKLQGKEGAKVIDRDTATAVARHAGAKWMLLGSILQEEPNLIMTSRLVDVESGKIVASQRITGEPEDQIFALVDRLTDEIKDDLSLPAAAKTGSDMPIAEVTTHSMEAYRHYLEGMEFANQFYGPEAKAAFEKALEYDSTFAMVYLRQASKLVTPSRAERKQAISRAVEYSDRVSQKEKHYIEAAAALFDGDVDRAIAELEAIIEEHPNDKTAYMSLGDIYRTYRVDTIKSIEYYRKVIDIDPLSKFAYNVLAYAYQAQGDIDNYIWAIHQYMMLAPDEANPYDSRADLYAFSGKVDKAIESYGEALKRKPDFYPSAIKLGHMYLFKGEYETAASYYEQVVASGDPDTRAIGRLLLVLIPVRQGKLDDVLEALRRGIAADEADGYAGRVYYEKGLAIAGVYAEKNDMDRAIAECEKWQAYYRARHPDDPLIGAAFLIQLLARKGDFDAADERLAVFKSEIEGNNKLKMLTYDFIKAAVELEKGEVDTACVEFEKITGTHEGFNIKYNLALAYLKAGRVIESANEFERLLRRYSEERATKPFESVRAHYYLGVAHEEAGRMDKAIKQYEEFLGIWKNADPAIDGISDAKERLARLRQTG